MIHGAWSRRRRLSMSSGAQRKRARRPTRLGWTTSGRPSRRLAACAMWSWLRSAAPTAGAAHVGPHPPAHRAAIGPQPPFQGTVASICMELPLRMQRAIAVCEGGGEGAGRGCGSMCQGLQPWVLEAAAVCSGARPIQLVSICIQVERDGRARLVRGGSARCGLPTAYRAREGGHLGAARPGL